MKTPEDEAFDELERRQGGFQAKRQMAVDKLQEPVKDWVASHNSICALLRQAHDALALTSYPPKRPWVGLTDEEIKDIIGSWGDTPIKGYTRKLFDQIEAKLKEKNNG